MRVLYFAIAAVVAIIPILSMPLERAAAQGIIQAKPQTVAPTDAHVPDPNIRQAQEWLVWIGYYDGPLDGELGTGTSSAIKRFQRDIKAAETGTLTPAQMTALADRAKLQIQAVGFTITTDTATGIRTGIPVALVPQKRTVSGGTNFTSADGRIQIGLRIFKNDQEFKSAFDEIKEAFKSSNLGYSALRNDWFALSGENDSKRFYLRYFTKNDMIAGGFAVYDKDISKETLGPLAAAITMMSLTMQPFAVSIDGRPLPRLSPGAIAGSSALVQQLPSDALGSTAARIPPAPVAAPAATTQPHATTAQASTAPLKSDDAAFRALQQRMTQVEQAQKRIENQLAKQNTELVEALDRSRATEHWMTAALIVIIVALGIAGIYIVKRMMPALNRNVGPTLSTSPSGGLTEQQEAAATAARESSIELVPAPVAALASRPGRASALGPLVAIGGLVSAAIVVILGVGAISALVGF